MPLSDEDIYKMFGPSSCAPDEIRPRVVKNYFVSGYNNQDNRHRCFGFYPTFNKAKEAILSNWKNMEECYYDSFFVEEMSEGIFQISKIIDFYEIDMETRSLIKKDPPHHLKGMVNWSIG